MNDKNVTPEPGQSSATEVTLRDLSKTFHSFRGNVEVLKSLDLTICPGEFFVLLGPSGCGKSTTLNLIAGLEKPSSGTISFSDRIVADPQNSIFLPPFERDISFVFQSYALYPHMTIKQNIEFPLTNLKKKLSAKQREEKVLQTAKILRIQNLLERKPSELSGGQRQRVAIGRAIVRNPSLFLMDEPLSNLDAKLRTEMRAELKSIQKRVRITTVYVTHDQVEAMTLGDRIAILDDGIIQQIGSPEEIYRTPTNIFVASFIGSPPMNLLEGTFNIESGKALFRSDDFTITLSEPLISLLTKVKSDNYILGIRSESLSLTDTEPDMQISIDVIENLGSEYLLHSFLKNGKKFVMQTARKPEDLEKTGLSVDMNRVHVFDCETGGRI